MMTHHYAGCKLPACELCDAYGDGYDKAHFELRAGDYLSHPEDDGCQPCTTIKFIVVKLGNDTIAELTKVHFEGRLKDTLERLVAEHFERRPKDGPGT